jgi:hypothetical protein
MQNNELDQCDECLSWSILSLKPACKATSNLFTPYEENCTEICCTKSVCHRKCNYICNRCNKNGLYPNNFSRNTLNITKIIHKEINNDDINSYKLLINSLKNTYLPFDIINVILSYIIYPNTDIILCKECHKELLHNINFLSPIIWRNCEN